MNFKTGSRNLDKLLHGGFPGGAVSTIMGEVGTGRTTLALSTAVSAVKAKRKVVYFDCGAEISGNTTFNLGLTPDYFSTIAPSNLEECLAAALQAIPLANLLLLDSPNLLQSSRGSVASVAGMFTNWVPKVSSALQDRPDTAVLITWQLRRAVTRAEKSANFGEPIALAHMNSVALLLERLDEEEGISVKVTKDRRDIVHAESPSCIIKFTGNGLFEDIRVAHEPIDRSKIPSRFDRDDVI